MKSKFLLIVLLFFFIIYSFYFNKSVALAGDAGSFNSSSVLYLNFKKMEVFSNVLANIPNHNIAFVYGKSSFSPFEVLRPEQDSFSFDGIDDAIIIPDNDNLSPSTSGNFTVSFWIKFKNTRFSSIGNKNYLQFMGKGTEDNYEFSFRQYNSSNSENKGDRVSFYLFNLSGGLGSGSFVQEPISTDDWVFLTAVYNGTNVEIWKNGALKDSDLLSEYGIISVNGKAPLIIGTLDGINYFKGEIKELHIYNKSLSSSEIFSLYARGKS